MKTKQLLNYNQNTHTAGNTFKSGNWQI